MISFRKKISRQQAFAKIVVHAVYGNHGITPRPKTEEDVVNFLKVRGHEINRFADSCRDPSQAVPYFENQAPSTWNVACTKGASIALVDEFGEEISSIEAEGELIHLTYWALFDSAISARNRSVELRSYLEYQSAIVSGIASIEAYINWLAANWNKRNPADQLIDSKAQKVSFEDKIDIWIPTITGKKFDKSRECWSHFTELRAIRDHLTIHPKIIGYGIEEKELCRKINLFRKGIANFLGGLHGLAGQPTPSIVINAAYMSDCVVAPISN
jgi:hypothetical protein